MFWETGEFGRSGPESDVVTTTACDQLLFSCQDNSQSQEVLLWWSNQNSFYNIEAKLALLFKIFSSLLCRSDNPTNSLMWGKFIPRSYRKHVAIQLSYGSEWSPETRCSDQQRTSSSMAKKINRTPFFQRHFIHAASQFFEAKLE